MSSQVLSNIGSVSRLQGFRGLRSEDQARVRKALEQGYVAEHAEAEAKVGVGQQEAGVGAEVGGITVTP